MNGKVLNDRGRFEDRDTFVFENREFRNRPELLRGLEILGRHGVHHLKFERRRILVSRLKAASLTALKQLARPTGLEPVFPP
jgi:hypothetical protein